MTMSCPLKALLAMVVAASFALFETADAHGYISSPRARNYYAYTEAKWWDFNENDPEPESDPYSLNRGGTAAQCGMVNGRNYDLPKNALGGLMKPTIQECYNAGSIIDISVTLTAYHGGHFEFHACPINHGEVPTESCFKDHPLEFVEDVLNDAPKDINYPERAYIYGLTSMTLGEFQYKYKLPDNLIGELVLIQWYYVTGNTCTDEGYANYPFPVGFTPYNAGITATCPLPITGDGSEAPERFWNCAEVRITEDCSITTTSTTTPATVCTPIPQSQLGYAVTEVSQSACNKCAQDNHESQYWPCDSNPPLCDCGLEPNGSSTTTAGTTTTTTSASTTTTTTTTTTSTAATPPPSLSPTPNPSKSPVTNPPTSLPTSVPTADPTEAPTNQPSKAPISPIPTKSPSKSPTATPTQNPTDQPTSSPTTSIPTQTPTTANPTEAPTDEPTNQPTTASPIQSPTSQPTNPPTTSIPTQTPTTANPTEAPTNEPTNQPTTASPTQSPTSQPTNPPSTISPTPVPTHPPTKQPVPGSTGWYVDGDKCVLGEPDTETLYPSASSCCDAQLSWVSNELCESRSTGVPTMKFYADQSASVCKQDCPAANGLPCGGSPPDTSLKLYSALESCCAAKIVWEPSCVDKSNGNEPQGTGNRYYVNWGLTKCALDCPEGSADGCGGVAKSWDTTYATSASCCAAISWVDSTQCVYGATTTTTTSTGATTTTTANDTAGTTCRAKTREEITNGAWPVPDETCKVCEGPYTWWPCGTAGICHCD